MNKIRLIISKNLVKRVFFVFMVGLVLRGVINLISNTEIIGDYCSFISIICYTVVCCFSVFCFEYTTIDYSVLSLKLIKDAVISHWENKDMLGDKMVCDGNGLNNNTENIKGSISDSYLTYSHNKLGESKSGSVRSSVSSSGRRSSGSSAGVSGLYGHNSRTSRPSAALRGLYGGNDQSSQTSQPSSRSNTYNRERDVDRDRRHHNNVSRDTRRHENSPVDVRDIRVVRDSGIGRVSGFNAEDRTRFMSYGFSSADYMRYIEAGYVMPSVEDVPTKIDFVYPNYNSNRVRSYDPSEIAITLREVSEYQGSINNGNDGNLVPPRAPRISNYSTPETMSPLFPPSENSSRRFYSTNRDVANRNWDSFYSNSTVPNRTSTDSDTIKMDMLHRKCREVTEVISKKCHSKDVNLKGAKRDKSLFWKRK
jgi:hypothetical protein